MNIRGSALAQRGTMSDDPEADVDGLEEDASRDAVAQIPNDIADPVEILDDLIPAAIRERYEVHSYRNAAVILKQAHGPEFEELMSVLEDFSITKDMIRMAGGNESEIPKLLSRRLRPLGWHETVIQGDLLVRLKWREEVRRTPAGKPVLANRERQLVREQYIDGHKIDYVKGRVAFELEWNSKDQTFDRDLFAFSAFAQCGAIDVGVLVTRGTSLNPIIRDLGPALKKDGSLETKPSGQHRMTREKYGASTTWMGKLLYRLNAGRNGACPVLAFGITPRCISDMEEQGGERS